MWAECQQQVQNTQDAYQNGVDLARKEESQRGAGENCPDGNGQRGMLSKDTGNTLKGGGSGIAGSYGKGEGDGSQGAGGDEEGVCGGFQPRGFFRPNY